MSATDTRTLAMIDYEVDQLRPKARAEAAFDTIGRTTDNNPWRGCTEKLRALERERTLVTRREHGERLITLLSERERLNATLVDLNQQHSRLTSDLTELDQNPVIARWRQAPLIANHLGSGWNWKNYAAFVESERPRPLTGNDVPLDAWPDALRFSDAERAVIHRWRHLRHDLDLTVQRRADADGRLQQLERDHPELVGIE